MQPTGILDPRHGESITKRICSAGELDGGAEKGKKEKKKKAEIPTYRFSLSCSSLTLKSCREGKDNNRGELQGWKVEDDCVCVRA